MDREQAKVITEYDHLFSTQMGLLLPWIGRLFGLGACRRQQDVRRRGKKDQLELHKSVERENRKDEDMLSCVVKCIVLTSPFSQCCLYVLASSQGSETVETWFPECCMGHPSSPLTDQSMWLINQRRAIGKQAVHQRSADTLIRPHLQPYQLCLMQGMLVHTYSRHDTEIS